MNKAEYLTGRELVRGNGFFYANRFWTEDQKAVFYRLGWGRHGIRRDRGDRLQRRSDMMKIAVHPENRIKQMLLTTDIKYVSDDLFFRFHAFPWDREF